MRFPDKEEIGSSNLLTPIMKFPTEEEHKKMLEYLKRRSGGRVTRPSAKRLHTGSNPVSAFRKLKCKLDFHKWVLVREYAKGHYLLQCEYCGHVISYVPSNFIRRVDWGKYEKLW
jgi:hypothetical protein